MPTPSRPLPATMPAEDAYVVALVLRRRREILDLFPLRDCGELDMIAAVLRRLGYEEP